MSKVILISNPTIGADIETFILDKGRGLIVTAEPYIKGTKYEPFNFDPSSPFFAISLDNVAAEFCIPPVTNNVDWLANIKKAVAYIDSVVPPNFQCVARPAAILNDEFLQSEAAKVFGCEPDYNAWLRCPNAKPTADNVNLRSCGGHIHIGFTKPTDEELSTLGIESPYTVDEYAIKAMDLFLGIPSVIQEPDNDRKILYGKAGAFRFKDYGVEYRTISNYYLESDDLTKWAFDNTLNAIKFVNDGRMEELEAVGDLIQTCINNNDKIAAGNLIRQFEIPLA